MFILGVDVETTGFDDNDEIIEIGIVLFHIEHKRIYSSYSKIYKAQHTWSEDAEKCHKISRDMTNLMDIIDNDNDPFEIVSGHLAKYIVAHNAEHDYKFLSKKWESFKSRPWICTCKDLPHNKLIDGVTSLKLGHLCVDYSINIGSWHQALSDAEACARIASRHNLDNAYMERKLRSYMLCVSTHKFVKNIKDILKNSPSCLDDGIYYKWNNDNAPPKTWSKLLKKDDLVREILYIKSQLNDNMKCDVIQVENSILP